MKIILIAIVTVFRSSGTPLTVARTRITRRIFGLPARLLLLGRLLLRGVLRGLVTFPRARRRIRARAVQHGLQDPSAGVDKPIVHLQQRQIRLAGNLPLLVLGRVGMLRQRCIGSRAERGIVLQSSVSILTTKC